MAMFSFDVFKSPHRRYNPLTGEWVLVSPHRTQRPWQGKKESIISQLRKPYDPACYLCPGNERANGEKNPDYTSTFVFTNDFSALFPEIASHKAELHPLIKFESVPGTCRVICFSPRHDLSLPEMEEKDIEKVIQVWIEQLQELGQTYRWVQIFENKGEIMGCSNPHPHGQIWASAELPNEPFKEEKHQKDYFLQTDRILLLDYLEIEMEREERIVLENPDWVALVPFWAIWPFEILLLPRKHRLRLTDLSVEEQKSLAQILKRLLIRYDNLFETSFPYTMGWHGAPTDNGEYFHWQLHCHFYPPLLRSATIKKFMVGYEMLSEPQRDITPEHAAERLKNLSDVHYLQKK